MTDSEAFSDLGGQRGTPYDGAISRFCPTCRAEVGVKCTFRDGGGTVRFRHAPCVQRCKSVPS